MNNYKLRIKILSDVRLTPEQRLHLAALFEGVNWETRQHVFWAKAHRKNFCKNITDRFHLPSADLLDMHIYEFERMGWLSVTKQDNGSWVMELNANV